MREVMEDAFGAPCLFLLSPCGDTGPREGFVGDTAVADSNGRRLGFAAAAAVESLLPAGTQLEYDGPIISGATLGAWKRTRLDPPADDRSFALRSRTLRIDLPIKPHESPDALKAAHDQATRDLEAAQASGDPIAIRNATALRERARRRLLRGPTLPDGGTIPFDLHLWQIGDAFLLTVPAEPYSTLQKDFALPVSRPPPPHLRCHQRHPRLPSPSRPLRQEPLPGLGFLPRPQKPGDRDRNCTDRVSRLVHSHHLFLHLSSATSQPLRSLLPFVHDSQAGLTTNPVPSTKPPFIRGRVP